MHVSMWACAITLLILHLRQPAARQPTHTLQLITLHSPGVSGQTVGIRAEGDHQEIVFLNNSRV